MPTANAVPAPTARKQHRRPRRILAEILVGAAIAAGAVINTAAPAAADPDAVSTEPNPYGTLGCNCPETAPAHSPQLSEEIRRGIREGLTVSVPGLPAPAPRALPPP
ncbi:hypothetical protein [Mycobacterium sp.]|uniref:hypothetical protein n=1 Tax=Mycobacterium sp. TaxID=1785 RepID=UPI0025F439D8|nr:hypothetical protein [Mycobacterium sp.]MBW0014236.1 hypothetical protein [Mycobacterium sp.]